jgi:hypothetical protein
VKREIFESMLKKLYPNDKFEVVSYEILSKNQLNESGEWIPDSPAIFVGLRFTDVDLKHINLTNYFSDFTGFEFSISKV